MPSEAAPKVMKLGSEVRHNAPGVVVSEVVDIAGAEQPMDTEVIMSFLASGIAPMLAAYVILGCFIIIEPFTRQSHSARSLSASASDHGSTAVIGIAFAVSIALLLLALLLDAVSFARLPIGVWLGWAGIMVMLVGFTIRLWATRTLGAYFTRTLLVTENQRIVREGPYRFVRHPGYLGDLLLWIGAAIATRNAFVICCIALVMVIAYSYRMRQEEAMLRATLGEPYSTYMAQTKRLIPFVY